MSDRGGELTAIMSPPAGLARPQTAIPTCRSADSVYISSHPLGGSVRALESDRNRPTLVEIDRAPDGTPML
jgi:hypothetical protein